MDAARGASKTLLDKNTFQSNLDKPLCDLKDKTLFLSGALTLDTHTHTHEQLLFATTFAQWEAALKKGAGGGSLAACPARG